MEAGTGNGTHREISQNFDKKKRQLPSKGNWRNKKAHYSAVLDRVIMPIYCHNIPEEGQDFF